METQEYQNKNTQNKLDEAAIEDSLSQQISRFINTYPDHIQMLELIFDVQDINTLISEDYELNHRFIELSEEYDKNKDLLHEIKDLVQLKISIEELRKEGLNIRSKLNEILELTPA